MKIEVPRYLVIHHTADTHEVQADIVERSHASRGYTESSIGSHIAYHFLIGKDGTLKQNRPPIARTGHTRNQNVNLSSIAIVLAGNFDIERPTEAQLTTLRKLVAELDSTYHFEKIIPHMDASPTACPGKHLLAITDLWRGYEAPKHAPEGEDLGVWTITRYYTPVKGQERYYRDSYEADFKINCHGDCFSTADGTDLHNVEPLTSIACPPELPFGTRLWIEGYGVATCHDRGGAIKNKRLDIWAGYGTKAVDYIKATSNRGGQRKVIKLT